ncbi:MAG: arsenite efflux transporter metallochaperone ArsD [bacterium]
MENSIVLEIYDPALCCSTGVCGPRPDIKLIKINDILNKLKNDFGDRIEIKRHSISNEPKEFLSNNAVSSIIQKEGKASLPVCILNGELLTQGRYPEEGELYAEILKSSLISK